MKFIYLLLLPIVIIIMGCSSDPDTHVSSNWYKGNLHTHSYWSDGDEFPEVIMDWYKSRDYHFLALTDHNILAEGEKWVTIKPNSIYQQAYHSYLEDYGEEWVQSREDSLGRTQVKLKTYEEYVPLFQEKDRFLIFQSEEITDRFENKPIHLNATNVKTKIDPQGGESVAEVLQRNIDAVMLQRKNLNIPMIVHINHPNFGYAIALEDMIAIKDERFFELYNGHHMVHNMGDSARMSTEEMWDKINLAYLDKGQPLMYGLATDDSHHYHVKGVNWSNAGRGWIMVRAEQLDNKSIIDAMEDGDFYASTGVTLNELTIDNNEIHVGIENEEGVSYEISFIGCKKGQYETTVFKNIKGTQGHFEVTEDMLFVRCKIISSKLHENPVENMIYEMAWTQPVQYDKT